MMDINRIVQDLVDSRFRGLAGAAISATVPVKDTLINELAGKILASAAQASPPSGLPGGVRIDPSHVVPLIRKAVVRAEQGRIVLDVEIAID